MTSRESGSLDNINHPCHCLGVSNLNFAMGIAVVQLVEPRGNPVLSEVRVLPAVLTKTYSYDKPVQKTKIAAKAIRGIIPGRI